MTHKKGGVCLFAIPVAVLTCSIFIGGCFPKMVVYEGTRMSAGNAIDSIKQKAEKQAAQNDYNGAIKLYASIPDIDSKNPQAPYGLLKAGDLAVQIRSYKQADSYYNELTNNYPESDYAVDAKLGKGIVALREARYTEAAGELNTVATQAHGDKKGRAYFLLGESYYRAGMYKDSFTALSGALNLLSADQEVTLTQLLLEKIVDKSLSDDDVQDLLKNQYPAYELSLLRLKLAHTMFSFNDYKAAAGLVDAVIVSGVASPDIMNDALSLKNEILAITQVDMNNIGCILPLSGDFGPYGDQVLKGVELALGVFSSTSSKYRLFIMDSKGIPELAAKQAEKLVKDDHVAAIIGPLLAGTAQEAAYKMQDYGVPMISLSQKSGITGVGDYIFENSLTPDDQAYNIVNYAIGTLGIKQFAVLYPENTYGEEMMRAFVKQVLEHSGAITGLEGYPATETDFNVQIKKLVGTYYLDLRKEDIRKLPPDQKTNPPPVIDFTAVFIPDYYERVAMIAPQFLYYDVNNVQLLGGNGWSGEGLVQMGGRYIDGAVYTDGFFAQSTNKPAGLFVNAYREVFHKDPNVLSALGYDTAHIIMKAMDDAASRQDIKNNLQVIKEFPGVTGMTTYNGKRVPVKKLYLLKVNGKKIVEILH